MGFGAENVYPCLALEELAAIPVRDLAEEDSVLFVWATFPLIQTALDLIPAWGFEYKTLGFSWIKTNKDGTPCFGVGSYTKSNCEVCLMATRGHVGRLIKGREDDGTLRVRSNHVSSVVMARRRKHSQKPGEVRERIVALFGDVSRIELFARETAEGWDSWGDEL